MEEGILPHTAYSLPVYYVIGSAEAASNLGRFDGVRFGLREPGASITEMSSATRGRGFGPEVRRRIMLGTYLLSDDSGHRYYVQAQKVRALIRQDYENAFQRFDLLAGATTPDPAFKLGSKTDQPLEMYRTDICTLDDALAGVPSLSAPCGLSASGAHRAATDAPSLRKGCSSGWRIAWNRFWHTGASPLRRGREQLCGKESGGRHAPIAWETLSDG